MKLPVHYMDEKALELRMAAATLERLVERAGGSAGGEDSAQIRELTVAGENIEAAWADFERLQQSEEADWPEAKQRFEESLAAFTAALQAAVEVVGDPLEARVSETRAPQAQLLRS